MSDVKIGVTACVKLKNTAMLKLCEALGSQTALARAIGETPTNIGNLVNMKRFPSWLWNEDDNRRILLSAYLYQYTGKRLEAVFPEHLKGKTFNLKERRIEREIDVGLLEHKPLRMIEQVTPEDVVNDKETVVGLALLMKEKLTSREFLIVSRYSEGQTFRDIGKVLDVSGQRVEIIYKQAIIKLQKALKYNPDLCDTFGRSPRKLKEMGA